MALGRLRNEQELENWTRALLDRLGIRRASPIAFARGEVTVLAGGSVVVTHGLRGLVGVQLTAHFNGGSVPDTWSYEYVEGDATFTIHNTGPNTSAVSWLAYT